MLHGKALKLLLIHDPPYRPLRLICRADVAAYSGFKGLDINMLQKKKVSELHALAKEIGVMAAGLRKEELIFKIIEANAQKNSDSESGNVMVNTGVLQVIPEGYGFLRSANYNYLSLQTIFMFLLRRSSALTCVPVIRYQVR